MPPLQKRYWFSSVASSVLDIYIIDHFTYHIAALDRMARVDISNSVHDINDESSWNTILEASEEKLIGKHILIQFPSINHVTLCFFCFTVLDCHQGWCGKCEAVIPTFQRLFLDHANAEKRIAIANVPLIDPLVSKVQELIPKDANIQVSKIGCLPLFLMLRGKACVGVIQGVDTPGIIAQVGMNIPENKTNDDEMM